MLMFGSSKHNRENYPRKYFWTQEKETRIKFNPGLSANRPSNNWALGLVGFNLTLDGLNLHFHWCRFYWMPETGWWLCIHGVMVLETNSLLNLLSSFFCLVSPFQVMWSPWDTSLKCNDWEGLTSVTLSSNPWPLCIVIKNKTLLLIV